MNQTRVHILDTHFQGMTGVTAVYLVSGPEGPVLIETGPGSTLPAVLDELAAHGLRPADIRHVLLTHIHLDHAGAAGWWAQQGAQIHVHYAGAPHLIDPGRLLKSATRIYGERMDRLWGEIRPAPAERVTALRDGDVVHAAGLVFTAMETTGHAIHHHSYRLHHGSAEVAFTGDAAGVSLQYAGHPELPPVIDVPAPPPEFDLEAWLATIDRLDAAGFDRLYLTHFGPVADAHGHLSALRTLLVDSVAFLAARVREPSQGRPASERSAAHQPDRTELLEDYITWNRERVAALGLPAAAVAGYELANPLFMSVDGIMRYLGKRSG